MKNIKKVIIFLIVALVFFSAAVYIDYFVVVNRTSYPKISFKKQIDENLSVYNAILYRVWYCKLNDTYTIGNYNDKDAICSNALKYDKDGNYTNANGVTISAENMKLISAFYSYEIIGNMSGDDVEDALYVIKNAYKVKYKYYVDKAGDQQESHSGYKLIIFPKYELKGNEVKWLYSEDYYCINEKNEIAKYIKEDEDCFTFQEIGIDKKWCDLYKQSNINGSKIAEELCKGQ